MDNLKIGRIIYTKFNKFLILTKQDYEDFDNAGFVKKAFGKDDFKDKDHDYIN